VLHGVDLADEIEVSIGGAGSLAISMSLTEGLDELLPPPEENLAWSAARRFMDLTGAGLGVALRVRKRIPIGSGLGGGSANAAGVLIALNELHGSPLASGELVALGASLGTDVPYCVGGGTVLATGRGVDLTPLPCPRRLWFVLGISHRPLYTAEVYAAWRREPSPGPSGGPLALALGAGDPAEVAALLHNDLEPPARGLRPELAEGKRALLEAGALGACISGSGPTLVAVAAGEQEARSIAGAAADRFDRVEVTHSAAPCVERLE
jgi:4-diphosphocytidyl-2-C-methyl-D-erythritol kinase